MKYKVTEKRSVIVEYEIEAENETDAGNLLGDILSEDETDNYAEELLSVEEL